MPEATDRSSSAAPKILSSVPVVVIAECPKSKHEFSRLDVTFLGKPCRERRRLACRMYLSLQQFADGEEPVKRPSKSHCRANSSAQVHAETVLPALVLDSQHATP